MAVTDASVLISLAKTGRLGLLKAVFGEIAMPTQVKEEVVDAGLRISAPELIYIQQAMNEGWLRASRLTAREKELGQRLMNSTGLDPGEAEALAMAKLRDEILLVDEKEARTVARAIGVTPMGSAGVLLAAFRLRELNIEELEKAVRELSRVLWISPDIVADILGRAREE
jgi:predicted nucleic acid-binding protein